MARIANTDLFELVRQALAASGANPDMAHDTARALVEADRQGMGTHGVSRVPAYAAHLRNGRANGQANPRVVRSKGAAILVDAEQGLAFPACRLAVELAMEAAAQQGAAFAAVANSHHFGVAANHLLPVGAAGMVGLALGNSPAAMPAWDGKRPLLGTNPIAAAFPRRGDDPILIDLSPSAVSRGKLMMAAREGRPIPHGWALDPDGNPTTDPAAALAGSMLPAGGVKGTMLALLVELLAASLTGSHFGFEADSFLTRDGKPPRVGQVFLVIDPEALAGREVYFDRIEALVHAMLQESGVRLPGARRMAHQRKADEAGLEIPDALLQELRDIAKGGAQ